MIKRFVIYAFLGWSMEIIWTGLHSLTTGDLRLYGYTNLWMFFIYGMAVFLEPIHDVIEKWRWWFRGLIWVVIIWGIEYSTGLILKNILGVCPWFYSGMFAVDSLVRIDYGPAWFIAGLLFEKIHNLIDRYQTL